MQIRDAKTEETIGTANLSLMEDLSSKDKVMAYFDGAEWESIHPDDVEIYRSFQYDVREVYICNGVSSVFARAGQWLVSHLNDTIRDIPLQTEGL